jgi:hypothetical protein
VFAGCTGKQSKTRVPEISARARHCEFNRAKSLSTRGSGHVHCTILAALFCVARVPFGDRPRNDARHGCARREARSPQTQYLCFCRGKPGSGNPQRRSGVAASRPRAPRHRNNQNSRFVSKSPVYNSRKSKLGHWVLRVIGGSQTSTYVHRVNCVKISELLVRVEGPPLQVQQGGIYADKALGTR